MPKLDLMNSRSQPVHHKCLFDSTEYSALPQTGTARLRGFVNFDSQSHRPDMLDRNKSQALDSVDKPYKVKGVLKFSKEKPLKESYFVGNVAAQKFYCFKERMDSPIMNRILDREHDLPDDNVLKRIEAGKIAGGNWSASTSQRKPLSVAPTALGPGEYDVTAFEQSAQGSGTRVIKFNDVPTGRDGLIYEEAPSPTTYSPNHEYARPRSSKGVIPFSDISRFDNEHYRQPGYVQTSGMRLSPDFDRKWGWEKPDVPVKLNFTGPRLQKTREPITTAKEPRPDYGNKISIATAAMTTNKKYSMCFRSACIFLHAWRSTSHSCIVCRSTAPNRVYITPPTSPDLGPGTYRGAETPTFNPAFPDKESPFFLNDRVIDNEVFGDHYQTLYPRHFKGPDFRQHTFNLSNATELKALSFSDRLPTERKFKEASSFKDPERRMTQGYITKERINKLYPRFYQPPKTKT